MDQISSPDRVFCRPAREGDQADVTEFCKGIWEGGDYVPQAWQKWLHDPDGILAVAEYEGHAIACSKISRLGQGQWWLEGFRVDPQRQGMKVGARLHRYVVDWWLENAEGTLRLMTKGQNFPVHHLCETTGFRKTNEVCGYRAAVLEEPVDSFKPVTGLHDAAAFIADSESLRIAGGLTDLGWRICKPTEEVLQNYSNENTDYFHSLYWWRDRQGLFSAWEDEEEERRTLVLGVAACALEDMPALLMDVRRFAAARNFSEIFQIAFDIPQITSPLLAARFDKHWKRNNAFLFEQEHPCRRG